jgi:hypothetical protein
VANTLIHENRRLQFPLDTLVDALIELENKQGHWPPKATVVGASIDNSGDDKAGVILSVHRAEGGEVSERRYSLPMIAAAIVNYCLTMRVPIPRNSTKSIQVLEDSVALVLENTVMVQSRHEELSTLPAGSVLTVPAAPATAPPEEAVTPNASAAANGAAPPNEFASPNATAPPDQTTPPSEPAAPHEAQKTSSEPAG